MPACRYLSARYVSTKYPRPSRCTSGSIISTPGMDVCSTRTSELVLEQAKQILTVRARLHRRRKVTKIRGRNVSHPERDLLEARHHEPLPFLDSLDKGGSLYERLVRAGIEPRDAARQTLDGQLPALEIRTVHVGDLQLAPP